MPRTTTASFPSVELHNRSGKGPVVILCEHASPDIPEPYHDLGLDPAHRFSHAAWDPGARDVAMALSRALDAPLVASRVSRLVYDCNRPPEAASAMPERSEVVDVPGNRNLTEAQRAQRIESVYRPFCTAVTQRLEERAASHLPTALITVHSFTPDYHGKPRTVEIGILHDADRRLADAMLAQSHRLAHRQIRRNDPYGPEDGVTHSLKLHGIGHGLANVMIEIRNDLLGTPADASTMADELLLLIEPALAELGFEIPIRGDAHDA
ncbi:Predicted N-formylglutamate amidohydrolase [Billgrantia gudaonensis]|uniref:Predicted N-formylglutamate amidohydrolase n=1 Tax=Billgrantia gudaonensis TaxID=376427 RepID=A0A1G8PHQ8_9GAMM|nr:Predicted N-formylglutamate amidohydrolase [Halomonas gudaonensis]